MATRDSWVSWLEVRGVLPVVAGVEQEPDAGIDRIRDELDAAAAEPDHHPVGVATLGRDLPAPAAGTAAHADVRAVISVLDVVVARERDVRARCVEPAVAGRDARPGLAHGPGAAQVVGA